jgi:hypothetical protein
MTSEVQITTVEAKSYLIERIAEQAQLEEQPLSEKELKLLRFSEREPLDDFSDLGSDIDETFEHHITALLRKRYRTARRDNKSEAAMIRKAVKVLGKEDHYLNIMAKPALDPTKDLSIGVSILVVAVLMGVLFLAVKLIARYLP